MHSSKSQSRSFSDTEYSMYERLFHEYKVGPYNEIDPGCHHQPEDRVAINLSTDNNDT